MDDRRIIIADRDAGYRSQLADFFRKAGYRVDSTDSTDSTVRVLCGILEKQAPVLLLGSDFDNKVSSADLIHLLKKYNRHLNVILVSDEMTLSLARKVRQEGIFYHALKPATAGDTEELGQAVACAFKMHPASAQANPAPAKRGDTAVSGPARKSGFNWKGIMKALSWSVGISALIFGTGFLCLMTARKALDSGNLAIMIFLGFCALIVAGQLLPIFRIKLVLGRFGERQKAREKTPHDMK